MIVLIEDEYTFALNMQQFPVIRPLISDSQNLV